MSRPGTLASCIGGMAAVFLAGLFLVACQSSVFPSTSSTGAGSTSTAPDVSLGKTIYLYGTDASGRSISRSGVTGMMGSAVACVDCHGSDARGQTIQITMNEVQVPDIRWNTLVASPTEPGDVAFDADSFFLAVSRRDHRQAVLAGSATKKVFPGIGLRSLHDAACSSTRLANSSCPRISYGRWPRCAPWSW